MMADFPRRPWWRRRQGRRKALRFVAALAVVVVFGFPVYWIFSTSLKSPDEIFSYPPAWLPAGLRLENYTILFTGGDADALWHSLYIATTSTILSMLLGTIAAYSLARFRTGGATLPLAIISLRMIPPIVIVFPLFLLYVALGWVDRYIGLILLYTAMNLPYVIWTMRGYIEDVPIELEESAMIDGYSRLQILRRVVLPMARNGLMATAVFAFIMAMNEFVFALVLTRSRIVTFPVQITHYLSEQATYWAEIAAMSVLGSLPVFFAVVVMQRYLVRGISMGAVKG
jgi:multiple sugar transport system permease protein